MHLGKVIYGMLVSLDGYIEGPDGNFDWFEPDEELHRHFNELEKGYGMHLYGRRMYELMNEFWPTADTNPAAPDFIQEYARYWQKVPNVVFSRTLQPPVENARVISSVVPAEIVRLREESEGDLSVGGASIAAEFTRLGLIDEYWVYLCPVIVGGGKPMFSDVESPFRLEMLGTETFSGGVTLVRYRPDPNSAA